MLVQKGLPVDNEDTLEEYIPTTKRGLSGQSRCKIWNISGIVNECVMAKTSAMHATVPR
jgi:hypothetical protein